MIDCELHFRVGPDQKIVVTQYATWESRGECVLDLLVDLAENWPELLVGRSGAVWFRDAPRDPGWAASADLRFCNAKRSGEPSPFPKFSHPDSQRKIRKMSLEREGPLCRQANRDSLRGVARTRWRWSGIAFGSRLGEPNQSSCGSRKHPVVPRRTFRRKDPALRTPIRIACS